MTPQAIAALTVALLGVAGCTDHEQAAANLTATFLGEHIPILEDELAPTAGEPDQPTVPVAETPPPADLPEYVKWANDPNYQCHAQFRILSCLDDGRPVYIDGAFNQLPFGVMP